MVKASQELASLAEQRQKVGKGDGYDAAIARATIETFRDTEQQLELAREQALRSLEYLLGRYPAAEVAAATELAKAPGPVPAGLPSELLERRPDVVAAERRVAGAFYGIQEAKAARLPTIKLTGSVNDISSDLFILKNQDNPVWSAGASLLQPVFNAGALQTQVRIRTEQQKLALADYGRIGARAFGEVEGALSSEFAAGKRESMLGRAVTENQQALDLANVRYKVGSERPAWRPAAADRHVWIAVGVDSRADREARAARQSVPGPGGRIRRGAGAGRAGEVTGRRSQA